jgi:hypothetical protein
MSGVGAWTLKSGSISVAMFLVLAPLALRLGRSLATRAPRRVADAGRVASRGN